SDIRAIGALEQMQITFGIDDTDEISDELRTADPPLGKGVLFPHRGTARFVERMNGAFVIGDVKIFFVARETAQARQIPRPQKNAAEDVEARDATLIGDCTHLPLI